jgi:hypothetical protein
MPKDRTKIDPQDVQYNVPGESMFNQARNADGGTIVLCVKNGKPQMWSDRNPAQAQELLAQVFPSATLPKALERT